MTNSEPTRFVDQTWIDLLDPISVSLWMSRLGIDEGELRNIVRITGGFTQKVESHLTERKMFATHSPN